MKYNYLTNFERQLSLYDGMLIETGGSFGKGRLVGHEYESLCLDTARKFIMEGGKKEELLIIINKYILQYKDDKEWRYLDLEMSFLNSLEEKIEIL